MLKDGWWNQPSSAFAGPSGHRNERRWPSPLTRFYGCTQPSVMDSHVIMGIHILQFGVYGPPFWLTSSPCCGKITSLLEKPEFSIFTTAYFVETWYPSCKHKLFGCVADLERPTSFVNVHTMSHCNTLLGNCAQYWRTLHTRWISSLILSYDRLSCMMFTVDVRRCHIHSWLKSSSNYYAMQGNHPSCMQDRALGGEVLHSPLPLVCTHHT